MVRCERCHRKFSSYAGLEHHYTSKHPNVRKPAPLENQVVAEREAQTAYKANLHMRGPSRLKVAAFLLIVVVALGVIGYVAFTPHESSAAGRVSAGSAAPDFTLQDTSDTTFTLSAFRGKANVLLFFNEGLGCAPCLGQMTDLDQLNRQFTELNILVVSITGDHLDVLKQWAQTSGPAHGRVLSDHTLQVSKAYGMLDADVSMMPGTAPGHSFVLVNKSGVIVWRSDYGPYNMSVPNGEIIAAVRRALGG